ncbi:hypothetical protein GF378_02395 [Candidatus Pacearchaeota archaeon]|nr:hypothetical protein [Candidatus Pacearchaeota archaeon]
MKQQKDKIIPVAYDKAFNILKKSLRSYEDIGDLPGSLGSSNSNFSLRNFKYDVNGTILFDKEKFRDYLFVQIQIKGPDNNESFVNFDYFRDLNRLENISGKFNGQAIDKQYDFLSCLEHITRGMGLTEMRTKSQAKEFWENTDWFKFPDDTYRKHLRPSLN